ncbi:hypothetical protein L9F63_021224, partial [Diploptera punctata]
HKNVRLFITQCGLQSLQEAVYHAVPLLGIPFFSDQKYNGKKIQESGIGLVHHFKDLTKQSLQHAINEIINKTSFRENIEKLSALSKDEPETSLERLIWWTEYVIRNKGAKHLRSAAIDLHWYQYLLLDVSVFIFIIFSIIVIILHNFITFMSCSLMKIVKIKIKKY